MVTVSQPLVLLEAHEESICLSHLEFSTSVFGNDHAIVLARRGLVCGPLICFFSIETIMIFKTATSMIEEPHRKRKQHGSVVTKVSSDLSKKCGCSFQFMEIPYDSRKITLSCPLSIIQVQEDCTEKAEDEIVHAGILGAVPTN